jgi:sugar O-acyltransferase (sialic acid O-acetyltransferase NeuD family)
LRIAVLGAGGHARVIIALAVALDDVDVVALFDDDPAKHGTRVDGVPVCGALEEYNPSLHAERALFAIGDNHRRRELANSLDANWVSLFHPRAWVDPTLQIGRGSVVFAGAVVQAGTRVGAHSIINSGAVVDHDCVIGDYVHIAPGTALAGGVAVGDGALIGVGAVVSPRVSVGAWARIGAGAAVVSDIAQGVVAAGVPAKPL